MEKLLIEEFLVFSETMSVTRAAKALYLSQPTLSTHIANLETRLGFKLVKRSKQKLRLTKAGEEFARLARPLCVALDKTIEECKAIAMLEENEIAIFNLLNYLKDWTIISDIIADRHNRIPFKLIPYPLPEPSASDIELLRSGTINVAVHFSVQDMSRSNTVFKNDDWFYQRLGTERFVLWTTRDNPLAQRGDIRVEDLANMSLIMKKGQSTQNFYNACVTKLRQMGVSVEAVYRSFNEYADYAYLDYSSSTAICSETFFKSVLDGRYPELCALDVKDADCSLVVYLVSSELTPSIRELFSQIEQRNSA
jgi:DNA-binding transcriptional LysR family regulator